MRKLTLFFAFLLTMFAGTQVWADTAVNESFEDWETTSVADGWLLINNATYGSTYSYDYVVSDDYTASAGSKTLWNSSHGSSGTITSPMLVTPAMTGTLTFKYKKYNTSSSTKGYIDIFVYDESIGAATGSAVWRAYPNGANEAVSNFSEGSLTIGDTSKRYAIYLSDVCIDEFSYTLYEETGTITKPIAFAVTGTTYNSASFSWTAGGSETAWQIVYGTAGFDKDAATPVDVTTNPYTLSGLNENTSYEAYLRAVDGTDYSSWTSKVSFTTPVQYPVPTGFACTGYTATTATFCWTAGSTETAWEIKYSTTENFDPATEGTSQAVSENPYTLSGLTSETTYYAYIRANYGTGYSAWSEKITFTPSATMNTTVNDGTTTNSYIPVYGNWVDNVNYNKSQFVISSTTLTAVNGREIQKLTFYTSATSAIPWSGNVFDVYMKETDATTVATTLDRTGDKVFTGSLSVKSDGTMEVTLTEGFVYGGQNLMIGFDMTTKGSYSSTNFYGVTGTSGCSMYTSSGSGNSSTFLPKMTITSVPYEAPAVAKPKALAASEIKETSVKLSWTDGEAGLTAWEIKYSTTENFDPATEGTSVNADANPYTLTGLTAETTYYAYVRAKKGTDYSDWSNMVTFVPTKYASITVNDGTYTTGYGNVPFYGFYANKAETAGQYIIPKVNLSAADKGDISKLTLYSLSDNTDWGSAEFKVYLGEVDNTTFTSSGTTLVDWANMQEVYEGSLSVVNGLMDITFDNSYEYNGNNLIIGFLLTKTGTSRTVNWYGSQVNYAAAYSYYNYSNAYTTYSNNFSPKTTITYLPLTGAKMKVSTETIDFGKITPASSAADKQKVFTISNVGIADLTNISVTYSDAYNPDAFSLSDNIATSIAQNGEAITVTVTMDATTAGTYTGTITINADDQTEKTITVTGEYSSVPAEMAVTYDNADVPATVAFGTVNKQTVKTFSVTNDGDMPLNVTSIISSNTTDFTVSPATLTVAGGEAEEFTVSFLYDESDLDIEKTATITVTPSNEGLSAVSFEVTGTRSDFWSEDFSGNSLPTGWDAGANWTIENGVAKASWTNTSTYLTTPTLTVSATSDVMTFEYKATANNVNVKIQYSKDGGAFTDYSGTPSWISAMTEPATFTITGLSAGYYQFRFANDDFELDNFEGFKLAPAPIVLDQESSMNSIVVGVQNVTLNYVFSKASGRNYNTIALPFDLEDLSIFGEGVTAYTLKSYDADNNNITFSDVETLEAGKPYLLHADTPTTETSFTFYNVDVTEVAEGETAVTGATFHANYNYKAAGDITGTWYGINSTSGNVQKAGPTTHLLGFRAYITFDTEVDPARLNVTFVSEGSEGEATTIKGTELMNSQNGDIYDLQGRKVNNAQKGIYIQNGKKVVIK